MNSMDNISAPDPEKKKELKVYSFTRIINETPEKDDSKPNESGFKFILTLYDKEISIVAKNENQNSKFPNILYEKYISLETLQSFNKFFSILDTEKIFVIIQKSFEQNFDNISIKEDKLEIKLMVNFMDVVTEEITFELQMIKLSKEEETTFIKESIKLLNEEKTNLKNEIKLLNNIIGEIKKTSDEKDIEFKKILDEKEKDLQTKMEEKEKNLCLKMEESKKKLENKIDEIKTENQKREKEFQKKMDEMEKEFQSTIQKLQKEMEGVKQIEEYVREKIFIQKEDEEEIKQHSFDREISIEEDDFNMNITIFLYEEKIKFRIKEIENDLQNNSIVYETDFEMRDFGKISDYYKNEGGISSIFDFLIQLFDEGEKDSIEKGKDKIIMKVKYTLGVKEDEIDLEIFKKEMGLENTLINIDKSLKELNKQFKNDLLEKVYPIGSYYWSEKSDSPEEIFGGEWIKIKGRFLFASDSEHDVGKTGGEEYHTLSTDEIPHYISPFFNYFYFGNRTTLKEKKIKEYKDYFYQKEKEEYNGGVAPHNNMPPYLVANCWKRIA